MRAVATLILGVLALAGVACSSVPAYRVPIQPSAFTRFFSGDVPKTPDEAQAWLDEATRQVQGWEAPVRAACAISCAREKGCAPACLEAERDRLALVALRVDVQAGIDTWRRNGGSASEAATLTFLEVLARKRPELEGLLEVFRAWRGEAPSDGGPIVPAGGGR